MKLWLIHIFNWLYLPFLFFSFTATFVSKAKKKQNNIEDCVMLKCVMAHAVVNRRTGHFCLHDVGGNPFTIRVDENFCDT